MEFLIFGLIDIVFVVAGPYLAYLAFDNGNEMAGWIILAAWILVVAWGVYQWRRY